MREVIDRLEVERKRLHEEEKVNRKYSIEEIVDLYDAEEVRQDEEWQANCPAHDDDTPSLSISYKDGKILLYCHAGCPTDEVLAANGLTFANICDGNGTRTRVEDEYIYEDEQGHTSYKVIRWEGKKFSQHHWVGTEWRPGNKNPTLLWRLPQVLKAIKDGKTIFVVEGEKDVKTLESWGLVATTASGGAIKGDKDKRLGSFLKLTDAKSVVIIPDNDDPGLLSAETIAEFVYDLVEEVKVVPLPEKDVSDWRQTGGTKEQLDALVEQATPYQSLSSKDAVRYLFGRYDLVKIGGKTLAFDKYIFGYYEEISVSTRREFLDGDGGRMVTIPATQGTKPVEIPAGEIWWKSKVVSGAKRLVFKPDNDYSRRSELNLFRGWGVQPKSSGGSCVLFKNHLRDNICHGDLDLFKFVWDWFADIIQHPAKKNGVILVIRGEQGAGKGFIGEVVMSKILGSLYTILNDPEALANRFNSVLSNKLFVHLDEAFFSGEHSVRNKIKTLSTSPFVQIELKGHEKIKHPNYMRLFITTNNEWACPAERGDRRYCVLDADKTHANDEKYFDPIFKELENGGYETLLYEWRNTPITSNWHKIPMTDAKVEQIEQGERGYIRWLRESMACWEADPLTETMIWAKPGKEYTTNALYDFYARWHQESKEYDRLETRIAFGKHICKTLGIQSTAKNFGGHTCRVYQLPSQQDIEAAIAIK